MTERDDPVNGAARDEETGQFTRETDTGMGTALSDGSGHPDTRAERRELLDALDAALEEARYQCEHGRIKDAEKDRARQGYLRCVGYLANQKRAVLRDMELDDLAERVERLEDRAATADGRGGNGNGSGNVDTGDLPLVQLEDSR